MRKALFVLSVLVVSAASTAPAAAHATVQPNEAIAGSFARFVLRVPNERPDAATVKVEVQFPETLALVSFQDIAGWQRTVERKALAQPVEIFGDTITEYVASVTWEGGRIEPNEFEEFGFSARMPEGPTMLRFPALQTYDSGEVVRWVGPPGTDEPAAQVTTVSLGGPEGAGQLQVLARLASQSGPAAQAPARDEGRDMGVLLGGAGLALGAVALVVALTQRRNA